MQLNTNIKNNDYLFKSIIDSLKKPFLLCSYLYDEKNQIRDYKILYANKAFSEISGLSSDKLAGKIITDVFNLKSPPWLEQTLQSSDTGNTVEFETYFEPLEKHFEISILHPDRNLTSFIFNDITKKVNTIVSLKVINKEYECLYESAPDMFLTVSLVSGKIIKCNGRFAEKFSLSKKDITGRYLKDFTSENSADEPEKIFQDLKRINFIENIEIELSAAGSEKLIVSVNAVAESSGSEPHSCRMSLRDMTRQREMETALDFAEKRLKSFIESADDMIYFQSLDGELSLMNSANEAVTGYSLQEFKEYPNIWEEILHPEDLEAAKAFFKEHKEGCPFFETEYRLYTKTGELKYIYSKMIGVKDKNGKYTGYYCIDRDISALKEIQNEINLSRKKADEANRLKTIILNNLGHELRTPLNGILGFAQILMDEIKDEELLEMAGYIKESGVRLERTLNSLLALSELETTRKNVHLEKINLGDFLRSYCITFEDSFTRKALNFKIIIENEDLSAVIDENLTIQILFNLLDNALKYTQKGGVTIKAYRRTFNSKPWACISVIDTGSGISPSNIDNIFEAFRQGSEGIARMHEGVGIGLTLTKKMAELQKGHILVESEVNKGSDFTLLLPEN